MKTIEENVAMVIWNQFRECSVVTWVDEQDKRKFKKCASMVLDELQSENEAMAAQIVALREFISNALKAIDKYPERKNHMTASEVYFRQALALTPSEAVERMRKKDAVIKQLSHAIIDAQSCGSASHCPFCGAYNQSGFEKIDGASFENHTIDCVVNIAIEAARSEVE